MLFLYTKNKLDKLKKLRENKKGFSTLEVGIGALIVICLLCFAIDLIIFIWKFSVSTDVATYVGRTLGLQGGCLNSAPNNYSQSSQYYVTNKDMYDTVKSLYATTGIDESKWVVEVNGQKLTPNSQLKFDYQEQIVVVATMEYSWDFTKHILPVKDSYIGSTKATVSEYKYSYNDWDKLGE